MEFNVVVTHLNPPLATFFVVPLTVTSLLVLSVEKCMLVAASFSFAVFHLVGVR